MAAGDLPPYVVSGQPIASAWGNAVVDELLRLRNEQDVYWTHPGGSHQFMGAILIGTTNIGPLNYRARVRLVAQFNMGYSGAGVSCSASIGTLNGSGTIGAADQYIHSARYITQTLIATWTIAPGTEGGFQTFCNWNATEASGVGVYFSAAGTYRLQRIGTP